MWFWQAGESEFSSVGWNMSLGIAIGKREHSKSELYMGLASRLLLEITSGLDRKNQGRSLVLRTRTGIAVLQGKDLEDTGPHEVYSAHRSWVHGTKDHRPLEYWIRAATWELKALVLILVLLLESCGTLEHKLISLFEPQFPHCKMRQGLTWWALSKD